MSKPELETGLLRAFQEDHARLGDGFFRLSERLRANDPDGARAVARELDELAGPHIGFEEEDFYPRLVPILGSADVDRLRAEHDLALDTIRMLLEDAGAFDEAQRAELLRGSEQMESHIAECGELFQALAQMPLEEQADLRARLMEWRRRRPHWTELHAMLASGAPA